MSNNNLNSLPPETPEFNNIDKYYKTTTTIRRCRSSMDSWEKDSFTVLEGDMIYIIGYESNCYFCLSVNQASVFYLHKDNFSYMLEEIKI